MIAALAALSLAAGPLELGSSGFMGRGLRTDQLTFYSAVFDAQLRRSGVKVGPAGVDGTVHGTLARVGPNLVQIDVECTVAPDGKTAAAFSVIAHGELELVAQLERIAQELASELFKRLERGPSPQPVLALPQRPAQPASMLAPLGVALVGAAALGGGIALTFVAKGQLDDVRRGVPPSWPQAQAQATSAKTMSTSGVLLAGAGAAVLAGGALYALVTSRSNARLEASAFVGPGQAGLAFSGSFP